MITYLPTGAGSGNLFRLDPTTGSFSLLISPSFDPGAFFGVVVGGPSPRFIYASATDAYALPLPVQ